jgi:hypothetical protein
MNAYRIIYLYCLIEQGVKKSQYAAGHSTLKMAKYLYLSWLLGQFENMQDYNSLYCPIDQGVKSEPKAVACDFKRRKCKRILVADDISCFKCAEKIDPPS